MEVINLLAGIIKNKDNSYEYLDIINNNLFCTHLDSNGFTKSDINYIKNVLKKLFFNSNCTYISKYNDYNVYYNKETNIKHFIKDGKEDFNLFYYLNGTDAILYNNQKSNKKDNLIKSFAIAGCTIILSGVFIGFLNQSQINILETGYDYKAESFVDNIVSDNDISKIYDDEIIDYKQALEYIKQSEVDYKIKDVLSNEELLQDVFEYYKGTSMERSASLNFNNIHISYFDTEEYNKDKDLNAIGYYSILHPNELFVSDEYKYENIKNNQEYKRVVGHEYIHLLQNHGIPYTYLLEASAELLTKEYFGTKVGCYKPAVKNLMLLTDIIGPEPIMQLIFGGKTNEFNNILKNNLTEEEYLKLTRYFQDTTLKTNHYEENKEIQSLLCTLYKNMYNKDITEDEDILFDLIYNNDDFDCTNSNKIYLNVRKMKDNDTIYFDYEQSIDYMINHGLAYKTTLNTYEREVSLDEYLQIDNKSNILVEIIDDKLPDGQYAISDRLFVYIFDENDYTHQISSLNIEEAYKLGYITIKERKKTDESSLSDEWIYKSSDRIEVTTKGLKLRFSEQYNNMIVNSENHKTLS